VYVLFRSFCSPLYLPSALSSQSCSSYSVLRFFLLPTNIKTKLTFFRLPLPPSCLLLSSEQIIELLAESMTFADKNGVGSDLVYEFIKEFMPIPSALGYGQKIMDNDFEGSRGFTLRGGLKDATHIRRLATESGAVMPSLDAVRPVPPSFPPCQKLTPYISRLTVTSSLPPLVEERTSTGLPLSLVLVSRLDSTRGRAGRTLRGTRMSPPPLVDPHLLLPPSLHSSFLYFAFDVFLLPSFASALLLRHPPFDLLTLFSLPRSGFGAKSDEPTKGNLEPEAVGGVKEVKNF
jgi:hypothetical protein